MSSPKTKDFSKFPVLQFPLASRAFRFREDNNQLYIHDIFRKKYVRLTPEEWVRQNCLRYFEEYFNVSERFIAVEKTIRLQGQERRPDAVIYDKNLVPKAIIECKSFTVSLTEEAIRQASIYNTVLKVEFLFITNGLMHFFLQFNPDTNTYEFCNTIPTSLF